MPLGDLPNEIQSKMMLSHVHLLIEKPEVFDFVSKYSNELQHFNSLMKVIEAEDFNDIEFIKQEIKSKRQVQKDYVEALSKTQLIDSVKIETYYNNINQLFVGNLTEFVLREQMMDILFNQNIANQILTSRMVITKYDVFIAKTPISEDSVRVDIRLEGISDKMKPMLKIEGEAQRLGENWSYELHFSKEELKEGIDGMIVYSKLGAWEEIDFELNDDLEKIQILSSEKDSKNRRPYR